MIYKIIVLGNPKAGKRELLTDFATQRFDEKYRFILDQKLCAFFLVDEISIPRLK